MKYFDHAATTPVDSRVFEVMRPYFGDSFFNASGLYGGGRQNASAIEKYESVVKNLTEIYPDKKLPSIEALERERTALITKRTEMNETYKRVAAELKEIEFAQTSLNEYLKSINRTHEKNNDVLE